MLRKLIASLKPERRQDQGDPDPLAQEMHRARAALDRGCAEEALAIAEAAAQTYPESAQPCVLASRIHLEARRADKAAEAARAALRRAPEDPSAALALPRALAAAGDVVGAERAIQRAQLVAGDRPEFWVDSGLFSLGLGRAEEAFTRFERAVAVAPHLAAGWINLAIVEQRRKGAHAALHWLEKAIAAEPESGVAWVNYGLALRDCERPDEAVIALRRAAQLRPRHATTRLNLASALLDVDETDQAQRELALAIELDPRLVEAYVAQAILCFKRGELDAARAAYERALQIDDSHPLAQTGLAELELHCRQFERGWTRYEHRLAGDLTTRRFGLPRWDGERLQKDYLLVYSEQGIGDMILFASCIPELRRRVERVVFEVPDKLLSLMRDSFPEVHVVPYAAQPTPEWFAAQPQLAAAVAAGSLMQHFRRTEADYPRHAGYLHADPARIARWRARLDAMGSGPRIGISWQGGLFRTGRKGRSLELGALLPLLRRKDASFVSLQYTRDAVAQVADLDARHGVHVAHWPDAIEDYAETAALVHSLDLVITVCTAVAHLAGALGKPVWIMAPASPSWRYLHAGETLPWYPSARVFRQRDPGEWAPVVAAVGNALAQGYGLLPASLDNEARLPSPALREPSGAAESTTMPAARARASGQSSELEDLERRFAGGDRKGALAALEARLDERPDWVAGYVKAARWHLASGDRDSAIDCLELALHHDPACTDALVARAEMSEAVGRHAAAVADLERVVELSPQSPDGAVRLARVLYGAGRHADARGAAERALALAPDHPDAQQVLGLAQIGLEEYEAAVQTFERLAEQYPRIKTVRVSLGSAYTHTGRFADARRQFDWVITNEPNNALARWDYASLQLADHDFAAGWENYEYRHHSLPAGVYEPSAHVPRWAGEPLDGRTLAVFAEQGLGDEIMFASCLPDVLRRVKRLILTCDARLVALMKRSFPGVEVYERAKGVPPVAAQADFETMAGTLPLHLRRSVEAFPAHNGYLVADASQVQRWRERLGALGPRRKIGISWRGGTAGTRTSLRTVPLETLVAGLADLDAELVSLQYGDVAAEISAVAARHGVEVRHYPEVIPDYDQTAALVCALDGVVSVCTSIVHLCGALGRPVQVLVPSVPEWRYGVRGSRMPWYPSARLYRQERGEPWANVVARVRAALANG